MKKTVPAILCALLLSIGLLAAAIHSLAAAEWVMLPMMARYAPPEATGLPEEEYEPVVAMITAYLRGETDSFQHVYPVDGGECAAFNLKEQTHMADVQRLFGLCRRAAWLSCGFSCAVALILRGKLDWRAFRRTLLVILALVTVVIVLAVIDFDGLFILFHKAAFTNDLWLLDPRTDMLIRLMPIGFFISYAAAIGLAWLLGMAALLTAASVLIRSSKRKKEE